MAEKKKNVCGGGDGGEKANLKSEQVCYEISDNKFTADNCSPHNNSESFLKYRSLPTS